MQTTVTKITNGFLKYKEIHKYTWIQHTKKLRSMINYESVKQCSLLKLEEGLELKLQI